MWRRDRGGGGRLVPGLLGVRFPLPARRPDCRGLAQIERKTKMAFPWEFDWRWRAAVLDELQSRGFALPGDLNLRYAEEPRDVHGVAMMRGWGHMDYGPNTGRWRLSLDCCTWRKLPTDWPSQWIVEEAANYVQERVDLPLRGDKPARWLEGSWWVSEGTPSLAEAAVLGEVPACRVRAEVLEVWPGLEIDGLEVAYHRDGSGVCDGMTASFGGRELFVPAESVKNETAVGEIVAWLGSFTVGDLEAWRRPYGSRGEAVAAARELALRYVSFHVPAGVVERNFVDMSQADLLVCDGNTLCLEDRKQVEHVLSGVFRAKWFIRWDTEKKIADVEGKFVEAGYRRGPDGRLVRGEDWVRFELNPVRGEVTVRYSPGGLVDFETGGSPWGVGYAVHKAAWKNGWSVEDRRALAASIPGTDMELRDLVK